VGDDRLGQHCKIVVRETPSSQIADSDDGK